MKWLGKENYHKLMEAYEELPLPAKLVCGIGLVYLVFRGIPLLVYLLQALLIIGLLFFVCLSCVVGDETAAKMEKFKYSFLSFLKTDKEEEESKSAG